MIETVGVVGFISGPARPGRARAGPGNRKKSMTPHQAIFHVFSHFHRPRGTGGWKKPSEMVPGMKLHPANRFFSTIYDDRLELWAFFGVLKPLAGWPAGQPAGRPGPGENLKM